MLQYPAFLIYLFELINKQNHCLYDPPPPPPSRVQLLRLWGIVQDSVCSTNTWELSLMSQSGMKLTTPGLIVQRISCGHLICCCVFFHGLHLCSKLKSCLSLIKLLFGYNVNLLIPLRICPSNPPMIIFKIQAAVTWSV